MPTSLPTRRPRRPDLFLLFLVALSVAFSVIELVDPAPVEGEAALITSP